MLNGVQPLLDVSIKLSKPFSLYNIGTILRTIFYMYDYLIVTQLPAFYKVNLYNEIAKKQKIKVLFIANETLEKRSGDFSFIKCATFEYMVLNRGAFQKRNKLLSLCKLIKLKFLSKYKKVLLNGWDLPEFWLLAFLSAKSKNCLALESTVFESRVEGAHGRIKKIFLSRISTVFASGVLHKALLNKLSYTSDIIITQGVGIINKVPFNIINKSYQKKFLFVGRITAVKNLEFLVAIFNGLPQHHLSIVGDGEILALLKKQAKNNIAFLGAVDNAQLQPLYLSHDFLILPSLCEPWGLVVEEALYFGLPVIISKQCGSSQLIQPGVNGFIFNPHDKNELTQLIKSINALNYNKLSITAEKLQIKDREQVASYEQ